MSSELVELNLLSAAFVEDPDYLKPEVEESSTGTGGADGTNEDGAISTTTQAAAILAAAYALVF